MDKSSFNDLPSREKIQQMIFNEHKSFFGLVSKTSEVNRIMNDNYCFIQTPRVKKNKNEINPSAVNFKEALLNTVFYLKANENNVDDLIDEVLQQYREKNLPSLWFVGPDSSPSDLTDHLTKKGLQQIKSADGIFAQLGTETREIILPSDVELITLNKKSQFDDWIKPIQLANNIDRNTTASYRIMFEELFELTDKIRHYIAYFQNQPIASSTLYFGPESIGLYNRSSIQVSARLTHKLALNVMIQNEFNDAIKHGYRYVTSQCTPATTRAVKRLGFEAYHSYKVFYGI